MNKIKLIIAFVLLFVFFNKSYSVWDQYLPVAKIVSYKDVIWNNIEEVWWWTAIVLNKDGYLLASSFSVNNMEWVSSEYYNICLTKDYSTKPSCLYTASLVDYDEDLELAILKLDDKNTSWSWVDLTKLSYLEIAYSYKTKWEEEYYSIWYPGNLDWLIQKKKWKFTWESIYKNHKYLKSDALLSNKFFGWAFTNKDGKLIWFSSNYISEFYNTSSLYSLDINEAKSFIEKNIWKAPLSINNSDNFIKVSEKLNSLNNSLKISDNFVNFSFKKDYEIKRYNLDKWFILKPRVDNDALVNYMEVRLEKNIKVDNYDELLYFFSSQNLYDKNKDKVWKKKIWQVEFTHILINSDSFNEKHIYATKLEDKLVIIFSNRKKFSDQYKEKASIASLDEILTTISFNKSWIKNIETNLKIDKPKITISTWSMLSDTQGEAINYFWKLTDFFQLSLKELEKNNWKTKTLDQMYLEDTSWIEGDYKKKIKFLWHDGYMYCPNKDIKTKDEKWFSFYKRYCYINIFNELKWINNKEYYLQWLLVSNRTTIVENLTKTVAYLESNVSIDKIWDGGTKIPNIYKTIVPLKFKDIKYQSDNFKSVLKTLVRYKVISNSLYYNPDEPIKWKDYLKTYFKFKYNYQFNTKFACSWGQYSCLFQNNYVDINWRKTSLFTIFKEMKIPLDYYVDYEKALVFDDYIELKLAWINAEYSEEWLKKYQKFKNDSSYSLIREKLDLYLEKKYPWEKISIYDEIWIDSKEEISYFQTKNVYFMFDKKSIVKKDIYKKWQFDFTSKDKINNDYCKWAYLNKCYKVMTKSMMVDLLVPKMNFSIFE